MAKSWQLCFKMEIRPNVYCPLCGIILQSDDLDDFEAASPTRKHLWFAEVRSVFISHTLPGLFRLTGVGYLESCNILSAPVEYKLSYTDTETLVEITLFKVLGHSGAMASITVVGHYFWQDYLITLDGKLILHSHSSASSIAHHVLSTQGSNLAMTTEVLKYT